MNMQKKLTVLSGLFKVDSDIEFAANTALANRGKDCVGSIGDTTTIRFDRCSSRSGSTGTDDHKKYC